MTIFFQCPLSLDLNECEMIPGICGEGTCVDANPGYECVCNDGYESVKLKHGIKCVGKD